MLQIPVLFHQYIRLFTVSSTLQVQSSAVVNELGGGSASKGKCNCSILTSTTPIQQSRITTALSPYPTFISQIYPDSQDVQC